MNPLGIDLGTTNSAIAIVDDNGKPIIINNMEGERVTPSVIAFVNDEIIVGTVAKQMQATGEVNIASFFKRAMGQNEFMCEFAGNTYNAIDLSAIVLRKLKKDAEDALGMVINKAVITVPAYFNNRQREATICAGNSAGLEVLKIINEPTAAAIAYGISHRQHQKNLVYDMGGGTFDVSLVGIDNNSINVLASDGDHQLGGKDFDDRIANFFAQSVIEEHRIDPLEDASCLHDIIVRSEKAKRQLSVCTRTRISFSFNDIKASYTLTRVLFEEMTCDLMERTRTLTEQVIKDAGITWENIDSVLLVGGATRMPMVERYMETMSGKKPIKGINVDESVALGAAIQAAEIEKTTQMVFILNDVMSHSLGMIAVSDSEDDSRYINSIIIAKNRPIPCKHSRPYTLSTNPTKENSVEVYMTQGESTDPMCVNIIGKYVFSGITHVEDGEAILDIEYAYDQNGVIQVSAIQRHIGKHLDLRIESVPTDLSWLLRSPTITATHKSVLIAIDLSGSMQGVPIATAQQVTLQWFDKIDLAHTSIGLIGFANQVKITHELSQNAKTLARGIKAWEHWMACNTVGCGNNAEPLSLCLQLLAGIKSERFIIVLTDGVWARTCQEQAKKKARECAKQGIEIITVGFGAADRNFIDELATADENALFTNLDGLSAAFGKIAKIITKDGINFKVEKTK